MLTLHELKNEEGFTLIELLIVILIIGILSAIAVPLFLNQRRTAIEATMKSDLRNNATIATGKINAQGNYPTVSPAEFVKSQDVNITYASNGTSFCIKATHASTPSTWYYDSVLDGISENSCSLKLDGTGVFYEASPGGDVIYPGSATWTQNGLGPSGLTAMKLQRVQGAPVGWGAYGLYEMSNGVIPAGSQIRISYYIKTTGNGNYAFQIINSDATSRVSYTNQVLTGSSSWKRVSHTLTTETDWIPRVHSMRWGLGGFSTLEISDVQVDVL